MNHGVEKKKLHAEPVSVPSELEQEIEELIRRYPQRRSAAVMVLHRLQEHFGWLSPALIEWAAERLGVEPIAVWELVTFYPMFRERPFGWFHFKICRTLSCALAGSHELHRWLCERLGLDPNRSGPQTTADGRFTVEFVECLARCHEAPVVVCNEEERGRVTIEELKRWVEELERADQVLGEDKGGKGDKDGLPKSNDNNKRG